MNELLFPLEMQDVPEDATANLFPVEMSDTPDMPDTSAIFPQEMSQPTSSTSDLPTISSLSQLPQDLLDRFVRHGQEGASTALAGLTSVIPGTENTIWRQRNEGETTGKYLASKLAPLGMLGGVSELMLSPATAFVSEAARGGAALESRMRDDARSPIMSTVEDWAPLITGLAVGGIGPVRTGLLGLLTGPGARSPGAQARSIAQRAALGVQSSEGALESLSRISPTAGELGAAIRESPMHATRYSALFRESDDLEKTLRAMTPAQQTLFDDMARGVIDPDTARRISDPATQNLIDKWQAFSKYDPMGLPSEQGTKIRFAESAGLSGKSLAGETVPFTPRPGFYSPKVYTPETSQQIREAIDFGKQTTGKDITVRGRLNLGDERPLLANSAYARNPNIQDPIVAQLAKENIKDFPTAALLDMENFSRTLGRARAFGPNNEKLNDMLLRISNEIGGPDGVQVSKSLLDSITRDLSAPIAKNVGLDSIRVFQAISKMPFSFVANLTQSAITAVVSGAKNTTQAIFETLYAVARNGELPKVVKDLGIINKTTSHALQQEISGAAPGFLRSTATVVLKPFELVERFNQIVAARAGELATTRLSNKLANTGNLAAREWRWLANSDLNIRDIQSRVAGQGGGLLPDEIRRGAWGLLDRTQFLARPTAMPYIMRRDPVMRLVFQMKTFAARATGAIYTEVLKEARHGNVAPLARLLAYYPIAGEAARQVSGRLKGREIEELPPPEVLAVLQRGLYNTMLVGGFGIASDAAYSMMKGQRSASGFMLGPTGSDIASDIPTFWNMTQHFMNIPAEKEQFETARSQLARSATRRIPFLGTRIAESLKTPQQQRQTPVY